MNHDFLFYSKPSKGILLFLWMTFLLISAEAQITPYSYQVRKKAEGENGAVVSAHPLASQVGIQVLKDGGNAFDAAIATQLTLAVVYPGAGNLGGGGFLLAYTADHKTVALDYREKAPGKAHRDMYLDANGKEQTNLSQQGHLASGVPGTVSGLFAAHRFGRLPFSRLIQPAIDLAEKGFVITAEEASNFNGAKESFLRNNTQKCVFVKNIPWKEGDTLFQPELALTLKRIRDRGEKGFYRGRTAKLLLQEMRRGGGIIRKKDLRQYHTVSRSAMSTEYRGYTILGMPLPSSGGILIGQMLGMSEFFPLGSYGFHSPESVQLMIEIERRAYADRAEFLGDMDFVKVPVKGLVSRNYLHKRIQDFTPGKAGSSQLTTHGILPLESEETTHLSVYDQWGNAVAVTTTLNGNYGSKTVVGGAGFLLNNEMDDFSIKPGVPNMYGALGTEANAIAPGKRMLSSMTPTIVLKDDRPFIVIGTPGGTTIPTQIYQALVNVIDFNLSLEEAINKPKFHHQWFPDVVLIEKDLPAVLVQTLRSMGYELKERKPIGRTEGIMIKGKQIIAIGDKRGDDHAEAY